MISEYIDDSRSYNTYGIKNVYLVPKGSEKHIVIDYDEGEGYYYADSFEFVPIKLPAGDITFSEESSIDERYAFEKSLTFTLEGYADAAMLDEFEYGIIELSNKTVWLVNIDFPAKLTYTYTLNDEVDHTVITMSSLSNYPTLIVRGGFNSIDYDCKGYVKAGIESLRIALKDDVALDIEEKQLYYFNDDAFKDVKPNRKSIQVQETYDGTKKRVTLSFSINMDEYKPSWHYQLLEFIENKYSAIVTKENSDNTLYLGFNEPLTPLYDMSAGTEDEGDIINVTFQCDSIRGIVAENEFYTEDLVSGNHWKFVKTTYNGDKAYECIGYATARYLLQEEVDASGSSTGKYRCLEGYDQYFKSLGYNITETFTEDFTFYEPECLESEECDFNTNIPYRITYNAVSCNTYWIESQCVWQITDIPSHISVTPSNGGAGRTNVTICNSLTPSDNTVENQLYIIYGMRNYLFSTVVTASNEGIIPLERHIDCLRQYVSFTVTDDCLMTVIQKPNDVEVIVTMNTIQVLVPKNEATAGTKTYQIVVRNCKGKDIALTIYQDHMYERWSDNGNYICEGGSSYRLLDRYTATTNSSSATWNKTGESKKGDLLVSNDVERCGSGLYKWEFRSHYICQDGDKFELEEEMVSTDNGVTWSLTGNVRIGRYVGKDDDFCSKEPQVRWILSSQFICES